MKVAQRPMYLLRLLPYRQLKLILSLRLYPIPASSHEQYSDILRIS